MPKIKCPAPNCDEELDEDNLTAQSAHMQLRHPEIINARLVEDGFRLTREGGWTDVRSND